MRWAQFWRINTVLTVIVVLLVAAWVIGSIVGLSFPPFAFAVAATAVVGINIGLGIWALRTTRTDAARVVAAHPGAVAFPSGLASWPQLDKAERESVIAVVADRSGLSFRDHQDREVQLVPATHIMSLELAPLDPRGRFRPYRVTTIDGGIIDFSGPAKPDDQVDAVVALRTALGRSAG